MSNHELTSNVPSAQTSTSVELQLAELRRWLEGYIDGEGKRHPGVIEMVGKLHEELEKRNERYEAIRRGACVVFLGTVFSALIVWFKDHYK